MHLKAKEEVGKMILQADESLSVVEQEKEGTIQIICILFCQSRLSVIDCTMTNQSTEQKQTDFVINL